MTKEQKLRLKEIENHTTDYEVVMTDGTTTYLITYTSPPTFEMMVRSMRCVAGEINDVAPSPVWERGNRILAGTFELKYSGRTEREAILEGEHPYVVTVAHKLHPPFNRKARM